VKWLLKSTRNAKLAQRVHLTSKFFWPFWFSPVGST